jgi:RNA polymerase sigma factor for flagellar operon FliA
MNFVESGTLHAAASLNYLPPVPAYTPASRSTRTGNKTANKTGNNTRNRAPNRAEEQERLLLEHLPIVRFVARRIQERLPQHIEFEELLAAGTLGLIDASRKFNPDKNVQFRSYAQFRIRGAILDSLRTLDWSPRELRRRGRAIEEAIRTLRSRFGRPPVHSEIALEMGITLASYQQLLGELKGLEVTALNADRSEDSDEEELAFVPGKKTDDPLYQLLDGESRQRLAAAIEKLSERERLVMTLYYYEEQTMKEIAQILGVVESRVSQIHGAAVEHLRSLMCEANSKPQKGAQANDRSTPRLRPLPLPLAGSRSIPVSHAAHAQR